MGRQYRTGIYSENENDLEVAKNFLRKSKKLLIEKS